MGEEEKKPKEKKEEEAKKAVEEKKSETPKADVEKAKDGNKEAKKAEEEAKESKDPPPPTPPQEIILRVYMHCEGCARKVRRCLKGFEGVENVETDCKTHKVVVKGEKADPLKVLERVQRKSHRQVELLSPIPKPPPEEPKKAEEKAVVKPEEKKEEPQVINVVLKVHMHCEACAAEIRRLIQRMKGVESAEPDLKSSQVAVKGAFEPPKLVDFIYKRTGKQAVIVKVEPEKKEGEKAKEGGKEEKKVEEVEKDAKKAEEAGKEKNDGGNNGGDQLAAKTEGEQEDPNLVMKKNEFYYNYPQNYQVYHHQRFVQQELDAYPSQIFSDENPNACSVM